MDPPPTPIRQLHAGETAVLQIASQRKIKIVLMDETAGRKAARQLGFEVFGILSLLIRAAEHGLVDLRNAFDRLRQTNFHISDSVLAEILSRPGL